MQSSDANGFGDACKRCLIPGRIGIAFKSVWLDPAARALQRRGLP